MAGGILAETIQRIDAAEAASLVSIEIPHTLRDGREFRNPVFNVHTDSAQRLFINSAQRETDFAELQRLRKPETNTSPLQSILNSLSEPRGIPVSNVGVSIPITLHLNGERYVLMQFREKDQRHMFFSGYVDSSLPGDRPITTRGLVTSHALEEARQEFIPSIRPGLAVSGSAGGALVESVLKELVIGSGDTLATVHGDHIDLGRPYPELPYTTDSACSWKLRSAPLPEFLHNIHPVHAPVFDGATLKDVGFQYSSIWNSGQLFFPFELILPQGARGLYFFQAEDGPVSGGKPWELATRLNPNGTVLVKLDATGQLTDQTFLLQDGILVPRLEFDRSNIKLSEGLAGPIEDNPVYRGFIDRTDIMYLDYRKLVDSRS